MELIILKAAIVIMGVYSLFNFVLTLKDFFASDKKKHFKVKVQQTDRRMWDLEFRKQELLAIREGVRMEYDKLNEKVIMEKNAIEEERKKEKPDLEAIAKVEKVLADNQEPDLAQLKKQMEALDSEIEGEANPDSVVRQLDGFRSLKKMLQDFAKKI